MAAEFIGRSDVDDRERGLISFWQAFKEQCPNTHAAHRELAIAMTAFEDGFARLRRALDPPRVQWPVRHAEPDVTGVDDGP